MAFARMPLPANEDGSDPRQITPRHLLPGAEGLPKGMRGEEVSFLFSFGC